MGAVGTGEERQRIDTYELVGLQVPLDRHFEISHATNASR
jgi:hypothetical protein